MKRTALRIGIVLWLFSSLISLSFLHRKPVSLPKLYRDVSSAVVWIGAEYDEDDMYYIRRFTGHDVKWQGTGFFVTPNLIATAGHVTKNTKSFEVMFQDGTRAKADFVHMENMNRCDIGFIQLRSEHRKNRPYLEFDTEVEIGEDLAILGYPHGLNNGITLTKGIMSLSNRNEPYFGAKLIIHTDAAAWYGNSGGPVIDMDGEVVGILIGKSLEGDNFSMVTPAKLIKFAMQKALAEIGLRDAPN